MSLRVFYEVLNQRGTPALFTDTFANRPTFGFQGRLFISTDTAQIFEDTGTAWTLIADATGSVSGFVPYTGATANVNLGSFDLTTDIAIANQIKAVGSGGLSINANSGTQVADFGAGGGANMTLFGGLSGTSASFSSSITGNTIVKSGGTSAEILAANGSVITAGTNITISGGTISSSGGGMAIGGSITSATAGSVLFVGTSGVLQQDNANFFWDDTNNRLGIGTTTPSATASLLNSSASTGLDVASDKVIFRANTGVSTPRQVEISMGGATSTFLDAKGFGANYITDFGIRTYNSVGTNFNVFYGTSAGNVIIGGTTDAGFRLDVNGISRLNGNTSIGVVPANWVGITALEIGFKGNNLHASGNNDMNIGSNIYFNGGYKYASNGRANLIEMFNGEFYFKNAISGTADAALTLVTPMTITNTNNVLINSTVDNGQGKLQVSGNIYVTGIGAAGSTYSVSSTLSTAYYHVFTGAAGQTLTLPSPASNNVQYVIINNTANTVTVAAATSTNIVTTLGTSVASITLIANQRVFIIANGGTNYFQIF